jgi:branched-chain amino acid aminotransferase
MSVYYINGEYVDSTQASIPANDLAILRGYGIFDFLRTHKGVPFQLQAHLRRLQKSAQLLELNCPWSIEELTTIVRETIKCNTYDDAYVRIVVTGGDSPDNFMPQGKPRLMVMVTPIPEIPETYYTNGAEVVTMEIERYIPGAKSLNYIPGIIARRKAMKINPKSIETIYRADGKIIEGTTTNTFMLKDGIWATPGDKLLPGITRGETIKLLESYSTLEIRDITVEDYKNADEIVITSTTKDVMPIVKVDDTVIGDGKPGQHTQRLMQAWREMVEVYVQDRV